MTEIASKSAINNGYGDYGSHSFIGKKAAKAIQAADLLAWHWYTERRNAASSIRRVRRADFSSLIRLPHVGKHLTDADLYAMAKSAYEGVPLPESVRMYEYIED